MASGKARRLFFFFGSPIMRLQTIERKGLAKTLWLAHTEKQLATEESPMSIVFIAFIVLAVVGVLGYLAYRAGTAIIEAIMGGGR